MSIRLMHLADLHLGAPFSYLGSKAEQRSNDIESALLRALELAPRKNVHAIVIAGDLFDSFDPPSALVQRVKNAFAGTAAQGIPIILIPGTHDSDRYARCVYKREQFPETQILFGLTKPVERELNGHRVHFYGFHGSGARSHEAPAFRRGSEEGLHIALVHGSISEGVHWSPSTRDFSLKPNELSASGFDYVALGHHHNFKEYRHGDVSAVYPGTLEGLKFGESGDRCLIIAEIDKNRVSIEKMKHNRRTLSEVVIDFSTAGISSDEELAAVIAKHADADSIVKISLLGTAGFVPAAQKIETELADHFFHLEIVDAATVYDSDMIRSAMNESTVRGIFVRKMLQRIERSSDEDRPAAELALRLGIQQFMQMNSSD